MLWIIFSALLLLWFAGFVSGVLLNGFIHVLLFLALLALVVRILLALRRS